MSTFTKPLIIKMLPNERFELAESFDFHVGHVGSGEVITVPKGFITDLTSTPRIFWPLVSPHGYHSKAAVLHDYLLIKGIKTKKYADDVFNEALAVLDVPRLKRFVMYKAVQIFSSGNY